MQPLTPNSSLSSGLTVPLTTNAVNLVEMKEMLGNMTEASGSLGVRFICISIHGFQV